MMMYFKKVICQQNRNPELGEFLLKKKKKKLGIFLSVLILHEVLT